jgi:AcrR family transcriptional regulator
MNSPAPIDLNKGLNGKAEKTREDLLIAGIQLFSEQGYEATSTRQVEALAGVQRNLMSYHFGSKERFWKACMSRLKDELASVLGTYVSTSKDVEPRARIQLLIRHYVRASAARPELSRILFDEGRNKGWRLDWLVEQFSEGFFNSVRALFDEGRANGVIPDIEFPHFYYILVGGAALFSMSAECEVLTEKNAFAPAMIDAHAAALSKLLTHEK